MAFTSFHFAELGENPYPVRGHTELDNKDPENAYRVIVCVLWGFRLVHMAIRPIYELLALVPVDRLKSPIHRPQDRLSTPAPSGG